MQIWSIGTVALSEQMRLSRAGCFFAYASAALGARKPAVLAISIAAFGACLFGEACFPDDGPIRDQLFMMSGSMVGANIGLLYLFGIIHFVPARYT